MVLVCHDMSVNEMSPVTTWCFQCGQQFDGTSTDVVDSSQDVVAQQDCRECGVPTSTNVPIGADEVGSEDETQMAYDFHEWSPLGRFELHIRLSDADIVHSFDGVTMIVRETDEQKVDDLITEIEFDVMPTLDHSEPTLAYEIDELDKAQHTRLVQRLDNNGVAYAFDRAGVLFVHTKDEVLVDELLTTLDQELVSERNFGPGIAGDQGTVMSDLFLHLDRLAKKPTDAKAVVGFVETFALAEQMKLPYGVSVEVWSEVIDKCALLRNEIATDSVLGDNEIKELAGSVAAVLRKLV